MVKGTGVAKAAAEIADDEGNSVAIQMGLLGDEWNLLIIRLALLGVRRYNEWYEQLGIANSVLTARLRALSEAGVLTRVRYQDRPARHEYHLTEIGLDLWPVLLTLWWWEAEWAGEHVEPLPPMVHLECGEQFSPVLHCASCRRPADLADVSGVFGPSGSFERSAPRATTRRRSSSVASAGPGLFPETIALIGNRWSSATLAAAFFGCRRFTDFLQATLAPPTIVSDRLRVFCDMGVLTPVASASGSSRVEYRLTEKGRAFFPHMVTSLCWGDRWYRAPEGPAVIFTHKECKRIFDPVLYCSACDKEVQRSKIGVGGLPLYGG